MEDRWFGNEFQMLGATDENDLEVAMVVLRGGTHVSSAYFILLIYSVHFPNVHYNFIL